MPATRLALMPASRGVDWWWRVDSTELWPRTGHHQPHSHSITCSCRSMSNNLKLIIAILGYIFFIVNLQPQFSCLIDQGWSTPWEISGLILKSLNHMIFSNVGEVGVGWFPAILMRAGVLHCYCTTQVFGISCLSQREFIEK